MFSTRRIFTLLHKRYYNSERFRNFTEVSTKVLEIIVLYILPYGLSMHMLDIAHKNYISDQLKDQVKK